MESFFQVRFLESVLWVAAGNLVAASLALGLPAKSKLRNDMVQKIIKKGLPGFR